MPYILYKRRQYRDKSQFIRNAMDIHNYRPAFFRFMRANMLNRDLLYDAPLEKGDIAIDVGGFKGDWAARVQEKFEAKIYVFEPNPPVVEKLRKRFDDYTDIQIYDYGLGGQDAELDLIQKDMGSSFYSTRATSNLPTVKARVRDIATVLGELGHDEIGVIKLNIEGGEYEVMERLIETGWLPRVRCFMIQFHEWFKRAHKRRGKIQAALRETHDVEWDYKFIWEKWVRK